MREIANVSSSRRVRRTTWRELLQSDDRDAGALRNGCAELLGAAVVDAKYVSGLLRGDADPRPIGLDEPERPSAERALDERAARPPPARLTRTRDARHVDRRVRHRRYHPLVRRIDDDPSLCEQQFGIL